MAFALLSSLAGLSQAVSPYDETMNNIIKVNVLALPLKNLSVQYEKPLSPRVSVALGVRYMPTVALPFKSLLMNSFTDGDEDAKDIINKSRLGNFAITPEVRFYLGQGYGQGFYIAPYYRFVRFTTNTVTVNYNDNAVNAPKRSVNLGGDVHAHTGGIQLGAQWFLSHRIVLDWWILGAHYGSGAGSFTGVPSTPFTPGEQADVKKVIEDVDLPLVDKTVSVSANKVLVNVSGPFGGLRAGFCIGVRF